MKVRIFRSTVFLMPLFLTIGCASVPRYAVPVLPPPDRAFPPAALALVRLPVDINFPPGGNRVQRLDNLFKGGLRRLMPDLRDVPGLHLKSKMKDVWAALQVPIFLDKGIWLLIRPQTVCVGMMRTDLKRRSTLHTVLEMTADPEIVFGREPASVPAPMPKFPRFRRGPGTFQATTNILITYKDANQYFRDPRLRLIGMVFPGTGERKLTLEGIRLYGSGGQVIVEVKLFYNPPIINFTGKPAKLTVYLRGTPRYLPKKQMFDMPDLHYDIQSNDLIVQVADWLFKSDFERQLRQIAVLPIGSKIDLLRGKINEALNRPLSPTVRLRAQVNYLRVLDGFADNEGIEVRGAIQGAATLEVTLK